MRKNLNLKLKFNASAAAPHQGIADTAPTGDPCPGLVLSDPSHELVLLGLAAAAACNRDRPACARMCGAAAPALHRSPPHISWPSSLPRRRQHPPAAHQPAPWPACPPAAGCSGLAASGPRRKLRRPSCRRGAGSPPSGAGNCRQEGREGDRAAGDGAGNGAGACLPRTARRSSVGPSRLPLPGPAPRSPLSTPPPVPGLRRVFRRKTAGSLKLDVVIARPPSSPARACIRSSGLARGRARMVTDLELECTICTGDVVCCSEIRYLRAGCIGHNRQIPRPANNPFRVGRIVVKQTGRIRRLLGLGQDPQV